ncbi:DUF418 domain-containing protein [Corynebacterium sp. L4756]|uniref:DUF418 domain-containing protein n=1 Tax=unclassified Corynebacterium TaxID=2624378 RepID=UPI00374D0229
MAQEDTTAAQPSTTVKARMVVPDVARGVALLGIAMANVPTAWLSLGAEDTSFLGTINNGLDKFLALVTTMFIHNRGLPLFSTLLGFGVGLIAMSLWRKQFPAKRARRILVRRYFFLALFGMLHLIFIFYGDIMFYYGLTGMIIGLMLTVRDKTLSIIAYGLMGLITVMSIALLVSALVGGWDLSSMTETGMGFFDTTSFGGLLLFNITTFFLNLVSFPVYLFGYLAIMLIGFTWARRGMLADVPSHRKELWTWVVIGSIYILAIGLPWGLAEIGVLPVEVGPVFATVNLAMGSITGPALLAFFALVLQPFQAAVNRDEKTPTWLQVPMALGKRSMSGYLFQSIAFFLICYPVVFGFQPESVTAQVALAFGVWAVSVLLAWGMEKTNMQGPFEKMHRRLSYGPSMQPELYTAKQRRKMQSQAGNAESS